MKSPLIRTVVGMMAAWIIVFATVAVFRPLMPVDETRYMSVAWEMIVRGNWVLPTLNFEPYSHKPPLLFWLINLSWLFGGVHVWPARIVAFALTALFVWLSGKLARRLLPDIPNADVSAMLCLAALPMFLIYGSVIMFDTMMGACVLAAMLVLWRLAQSDTREWRLWAIFGGIIGLGILAKGPVALVYMLPAALLAPFWAPNITRRWYAGVFAALAMGAAIGLAWAIPAAIAGGHEYMDKIFFKQSAGRMVNAFDHRRPFWFYFMVLASFLAPLVLWPSLWSSVKQAASGMRKEASVRFILCWILPVFVFFSAISSKQFHYMIPVLPGFVILAVMALNRSHMPRLSSVGIPMALMLMPSLIIMLCGIVGLPLMKMEIPQASVHFGYLHIALTAVIVWWTSRSPGRIFNGLALAAFVMVVMAHAQLGQRFLPRYDLMPIRDAVAQYRDRPMAAAPKYDGEYGYALRLTHHVDSVGRENVAEWFAANPTGIMIGRYKEGKIPDEYEILYQQPFRTEEVLVIMQRMVMVGSK